jgi:hypothetical protein
VKSLLIFSFVVLSAAPVFCHEILFLGKTGVGKTTLVNVFYNHILGKDYGAGRDIIAPLLHEGKVLSVTVDQYKLDNSGNADGHSQTDEVRSFVASGPMGTVELWDTPGFIDTRGIAQDSINVDKIAKAISDTSFSAIVIVLDSTDFKRDTVESKANCNMMRRFLPKSALSHVIGVVNRSGAFKNGDREYFKAKLSGMLGVDASIYFINGSSLFDEKDARQLWDRDRESIEEIITVLSLKPRIMKPVSGRTIGAPTALHRMMDKAIDGVKLADETWEKFNEGIKMECMLEFILPDVYPLKTKKCAETLHAGRKKYEEMKDEFSRAFRIAKARLNTTAISDDFSPYIAYIEKKIERIISDRTLSDSERESQINEHMAWKKKFELMEGGL